MRKRPALSKFVLDSSAVLAVLREERGAEFVMERAQDGLISSVNLAEVFSYVLTRGSGRDSVEALIRAMRLREFPFDRHQADILASIYSGTLGSSVGFADRACLALAKSHGVAALTGDHDWLKHDIGVEVLLFSKRTAT